MNYYDYEVNGDYNRQRIKAEIDHIRMGDKAMQATQETTRRTTHFAGDLIERLVTIEKALQHKLSMLLHLPPRPAAIHIHRRR